jgi:hypothetical protein
MLKAATGDGEEPATAEADRLANSTVATSTGIIDRHLERVIALSPLQTQTLFALFGY